MIKPIETIYNGYRFRSRLEARWAVFFDTLGLEYQYEPEGFDLEDRGYLPDFWLPQWQCWAEIKPSVPKLSEYIKDLGRRAIKRKEYKLCQQLAMHTNKIVLLIGGDPWLKKDELGYEFKYGIAIFSPTMISLSGGYETPAAIQSPIAIRGYPGHCRLFEDHYSISRFLYGFICSKYKEHPELFDKPLPIRGDAAALIEADKIYWHKKYKCEHPSWYYGIAEDNFYFAFDDEAEWWQNLYISWIIGPSSYPGDVIYNALKAARQARFEHGETP